jgi:hypothetical protein
MPKGDGDFGGVHGQISNNQIRLEFFSLFDCLQSARSFTDE